MTKARAREIAEKLSNRQLEEMFKTAQIKIRDWKQPSFTNRGMSKGTVFNVLSKGGFDTPLHIRIKINMVMEFEEFLPKEILYEKWPAKKVVEHQEPEFLPVTVKPESEN